MLCIKRARAHWHLSWIYAHLVNNGHKEINMVSNSLKKYEKYHERKKNGDSMFVNGVTRENARACSYARFFYKMLKMTWNVCKKNLRQFWAFKNFARALTRGRTRTRAFSDLILTGLILTLIMINMIEKSLLVMKIWSRVYFQKISQNGAYMTSSVKVKVENLTVSCPHAYTYVCQISRYLIQPFPSNLANKKVGRNKKKL